MIHDWVAYAMAVLMGVLLGLMGGGGSILTVPVLVYVAGISPEIATGYSLFIVGSTSLVGTISYQAKQMVNIKTALLFSFPSLVTVFLVRRVILPAIPQDLATIGGFVIHKFLFLMVFFAGLMLFAASAMVRKPAANPNKPETTPLNHYRIGLQGIVVGFLSGMVGAGGGFLIIPALVLMANLPMKTAVGTSLMIITINSLVGFLGDALQQSHPIDWQFLAVFTSLAVGGILMGSNLVKYVSQQKLKHIFGYFLIVIACYILFKEFLINFYR